MLKKMQTRFILLTMSALFAVLFIIITGINIVNYNSVVEEVDELLTILAENDGTFPELKKEKPETPPPDTPENDNLQDENHDRFKPENIPPAKDETDSQNNKPVFPDDKPESSDKKPKNPSGHISPETPYESRFFSVIIDQESGSVIETDIDQIASIDAAQADEYAMTVYAKEKEKGCYLQYRYMCKETGNTVRIIFLDCGRRLESIWNFIIISHGISLLGFLIVTVIIIYFSNRIIRPISDSYEKQKRFITDASHEIKTPLTIINADADVLELELEGNEWIDDIKRQTKRLTELTNNLVLLARMEESFSSIPKVEFPVSDVVTEAVLSFQTFAQTQNKILDIHIQPLLSLTGDSKAIHQLTAILLDNAFKYSPEESSITVILDKPSKNKMLRLQVTNTTITPISKEQLNSLFERFYRTDPSRNSKTGGYGIGLSVAKAIVEAHNGKIKASSKNGTDLQIEVLLPL